MGKLMVKMPAGTLTVALGSKTYNVVDGIVQDIDDQAIMQHVNTLRALGGQIVDASKFPKRKVKKDNVR